MAYFRDVVGIDVSKQNLDLYVLSGQQRRTVANTAAGYGDLVSWLKSLGVRSLRDPGEGELSLPKRQISQAARRCLSTAALIRKMTSLSCISRNETQSVSRGQRSLGSRSFPPAPLEAEATITFAGAGAGAPARSVASSIWSSLPPTGAGPTYSTRTWAVPFL